MPKKNISFLINYFESKKKQVGLVVFFLVLIQIFDGFLPQMEIFLLHGHVVVPNTLFRIPLLVLLIFFSLCSRVNLPRFFQISIVTLMTYLLVDFCYLLLFKGYAKNPVYGLATYNNYYSIFLFLPFAFSLYASVSKISFYKIFGVISFPAILLGLFQYILNKPIISIASMNKHFEIQSVFFYKNHIRAFSLFSSGLFFGTFCVFLFSMAFAKLLMSKGRSRLFAAILAGFSLAGTLASLTRSNTVHILLVLFAVLLLHYYGRKYRFILMALPFIVLILSLTFLLFAPVLHKEILLIQKSLLHYNSRAGLSDYTSSESLLIRYDHWKELVSQYVKTPTDLLFGSGLVQSNHSPFKTDLVIDNSYLATVLNTGILGLALMIILLSAIWFYFYTRMLNSYDPFDTGVAAFFSTWPFYGLINNAWFIYGLIALIGVLVASAGSRNLLPTNRIGKRSLKPWILSNRSVGKKGTVGSHCGEGREKRP
jgi:hypothetical protein